MKTLACRCGNVELEIAAEPMVQFFCHCDDCQAVHGACYVGESVYPTDAVTIKKGSPTQWALKKNPRFTCGDCGTRLFIDVLGFGLRGVNAALLAPGEFKPRFHMHCEFAVRPIKDDLPHYKSRPARFGGTDDLVDW
jgi:hypothetical protein